MAYSQSFHGIILFRQEYRERDQIVKIFTRESGKQMFFIKNLQRPNHPLAQATLPFTRAVFLGKLNDSGFSFLQDTQEVQFSRNIQEDFEAQAVLTYLVQLIDASMEDHIVNEALYDLLENSIIAIDEGVPAMMVMHFFELKMLKFFGIGFEWRQCLYCDNTVGPFDLSIRLQGLLCPRHVEEDDFRLHANPKAVHVARQFVSLHSPRQIGTIRLSEGTIEALKRICDALMEEFIGIHLKSKKYIDHMQEWQTQLKLTRQRRNTEPENSSSEK